MALSRMGVSGWDQDWSRPRATFAPGQAPMQQRFKYIVQEVLGLHYGEIFATNLVFARSSRFNRILRPAERIRACMPVHAFMMDVVKPKRLWVMGNTNLAGDALVLRNVDYRKDETRGGWKIKHGAAVFCDRPVTLCHTPHLSWWDATEAGRLELLRFAFGQSS